MHKNATKCNETIGKWCKNKHGASKIIDTFETYHSALGGPTLSTRIEACVDITRDKKWEGVVVCTRAATWERRNSDETCRLPPISRSRSWKLYTPKLFLAQRHYRGSDWGRSPLFLPLDMQMHNVVWDWAQGSVILVLIVNTSSYGELFAGTLLFSRNSSTASNTTSALPLQALMHTNWSYIWEVLASALLERMSGWWSRRFIHFSLTPHTYPYIGSGWGDSPRCPTSPKH
jgi:hypothetical protein